MLKLAIIDDDRIIRRWLTHSVPWEQAGCELSGAASDGEQGLRLIEKERPHIVISDIKMPFMDGIQMAKIAKRQYPETEFILLTGFDDDLYIKKASEIKVSDYVFKPVDKETLLEKVRKITVKFKQSHTAYMH